MSSRTDADGCYAITDLEPFDVGKDQPNVRGIGPRVTLESRYMRARHAEFAQQTRLFKRTSDTADLVMEYGGSVEGRVIDAVTGKPAAEVVVTIRSTDRNKGDNLRQAQTDALGHYKITGLGPANYAIWARAEDRTSTALETVPAVANQTFQAPDLHLISGAWIEGRVVGEGARPVSRDPQSGNRLRIGLHGPSYPKQVPGMDWCAVEDDGRFRLRVAPGRNYLKIISSNRSLESYSPTRGLTNKDWKSRRANRGDCISACCPNNQW